MAAPQLKDMLNILLQSPKGILAVTLAVGSFFALIYIFLIKSSSSSKPKARRTASKQSSPTKSTPSKSVKSSPAPKKVSSAKKEATKSPASSNKGKSPDKKSTDSKTASTTKTSKTRQSDRVSGSQKASQKDEGEWITVSKKKPRATKKVSSPEQPTAPQTRRSTRRSTQALERS